MFAAGGLTFTACVYLANIVNLMMMNNFSLMGVSTVVLSVVSYVVTYYARNIMGKNPIYDTFDEVFLSSHCNFGILFVCIIVMLMEKVEHGKLI